MIVSSLFRGPGDAGSASDLPYDLSRPSGHWILPGVLREVSGLAWKDGLVYMVSDEEGTVYRYDTDLNEVVSSFDMKGKGDYEGIECVGSRVYLLRSDSRLYMIDENDAESGAAAKSELDIKENRNLEGLGYDHRNARFLVASKKVKLKKDQNRLLYSIPADATESKPRKLFAFDHDVMKEFILDNARSGAQRLALQAAYWNYGFHPSAVAVHPQSREIYILSYPRHQLCVLDTAYRLRYLSPLSTTLFPQPEGICFDEDGGLYISSEGRKGKGTLLKFNPM